MGKTQTVGKLGESEAEAYLRKLGYKIIQKNFRTKVGEIDIIAQDQDMLVFIEVKSRTSLLFGSPSEAVRSKKLRSMIKAAEYYRILHKHLPEKLRFDVIEVFLYPEFENKIHHIKNITI